MKRFLIASLLFLGISFINSLQAKELWVYCQANLLVPNEIARVEGLMKQAHDSGYTHFMIADSKFARLEQLDERYFQNVKQLQTTAAGLGIKIVPAVHPVGYSNDILSLNPNLAEGLPVVDADYVINKQLAQIDKNASDVSLPSLTTRKGWGFIDESFQVDGDAIRSTAPHSENTRVMKPLELKPFQHYHVSVKIKTDGFNAPIEVKPLNEKGHSLNYTHLKNQATQDWTQHDITFNSFDNTKVNLYIGAWGPTEGSIWLKDASVEICGAVNMIRRPAAPISVKFIDAAGRAFELVEGKDFETWSDPRMGVVPYEGEYEAWHDEPAIKIKKKVPDGTKLKVSYFHTHIVYDGQVCGAINDQAFEELLVKQSSGMTKLFPNCDYFMSHDEYRVMGWTASTISADVSKTPKQEHVSTWLSHNAAVCYESLHKLQPQSRVFTWSDMFDVHHNAVNDYYLVSGTLEKVSLPKEVCVMNWNGPKKLKSLKYFADLGHHQMIAGYYDSTPNEIVQWLDIIVDNKIPNVDGVMYTTWNRNFADMASFAEAAKKHPWFSAK
jgi:hypothetical protein